MKRETIIQRLDSQIAICRENDSDWISLTVETGRSILEYLKAQEPVEERVKRYGRLYRCRNCGTEYYLQSQKYCQECGSAVRFK